MSDEPVLVEVSLDNPSESGLVRIETESYDPFMRTTATLRKYKGLTPAVKRRATRIEKQANTGRGAAESQQIEEEQRTGYGLFDVVEPEYNMTYLARIYKMSPANYAAINAKVANIVMLGYDWILSLTAEEMLADIDTDTEAGAKRLERARRKLQRAKKQINDWLDRCNKRDTFEETMRKVWTDVEATGNGYLEIGRTNVGDVGYIGHIPSKTMRVRRKRDGYVQLVQDKAKFFRNFGDTNTPDPLTDSKIINEVIHFKKYDTDNSYYGIPDIIAAQGALAGDEFATRFNLDYFEHKAVPRYIVVTKGFQLSPEAEQRLLQFFMSMKGVSHRTMYLPLPKGDKDTPVEFELKPVETGVQDASFVKYHEMNTDAIFMAHRTPRSIVSVGANIGLAAARDAAKNFKETVCRPEQRIIEKKLRPLFGTKTDAFIFKLNELTLTDEDAMSKIHERQLRNKVKVPNEVRAELGLPGYEGGDRPMELKPQEAAEARAQTADSRERDRERSAAAPDNDGEGRNAQGEGRQVP